MYIYSTWIRYPVTVTTIFTCLQTLGWFTIYENFSSQSCSSVGELQVSTYLLLRFAGNLARHIDGCSDSSIVAITNHFADFSLQISGRIKSEIHLLR